MQTLQLKLNFSHSLCVHHINQKHWYIRHRLTFHINHRFLAYMQFALNLPLSLVGLTLEHFIANNYWKFLHHLNLKFDQKFNFELKYWIRLHALSRWVTEWIFAVIIMKIKISKMSQFKKNIVLVAYFHDSDHNSDYGSTRLKILIEKLI